MELYAGMTFLILVVAILIFFRGSVKETAAYAEKVITVNCSEGELDLVARTNEIMGKLEDIGPHRVEDLKEAFKSKKLGTYGKKEDK